MYFVDCHLIAFQSWPTAVPLPYARLSTTNDLLSTSFGPLDCLVKSQTVNNTAIKMGETMKHDFESEQQQREETWRPSDQPTEGALKVDERADAGESGQHAPGSSNNQQGVNAPDRSTLTDNS